jgi:triacylglycerol lipase
MAAPRGSPAMYFPAAPFALIDAVNCATLVGAAYDQCAQWISQGYPSRANFVWTPLATAIRYSYSTPLFWSYTWIDEAYDEPFGFVAQAANGDTTLALRGTVTAADDIQDARLDQTRYLLAAGYGSVHAGFYTIYDELSPQILSVLDRLDDVGRVYFTGHSLGSGLSSLAVPDVITNTALKPSASLPLLHYNFASPRVGDPQFAYASNRNGVPTFRIVNTEDIVPDAPPAVIGTVLYKHIGVPVDFTAQYDAYDLNHSLATAYDYALNNPTDPEGPLPAPLLALTLPALRSRRFSP